MEDKRQKRVRYKLKKVTRRKRLTVFRSNKHLYAQVIDDSVGKTLASASSKEKGFDTNIKDRKSMAEVCLLYTSPSPRDKRQSRMPSSA